MTKALIPFIAVFCVFQSFSQTKETCTSPETESVLDLNSITKCSVDDKKNKNSKVKKVAVEVTSRRRVVRKRDAATGVMTNDYSHKLANMKKKAAIINNLNVSNSNGLKIIPFDFVDEVPLFKECEKAPLYQQGKCFKRELTKHIKRNLRYPEKSYDRGIQGSVFVHFVINRDGKVDKIKVVPPYKGEELGEEAEKIIKRLPKFKPGKHEGALTEVKYGLPITFKIPGVKASNIRKTVTKTVASVYEFDNVDRIPLFETCKNTKDASINCFNTRMIEHIQDNFAYPMEAIDKNIEGRVTVKFVINSKGEVMNIRAIGPITGRVLEKAAIELVQKLPKFKAAEKDGKKVNVNYEFPVVFKLN